MSTEIEDEAIWAAHLAEFREREREALAELEAWHHLPEEKRTRQSLEAIAAKHPRHVRLEWLPDRRVKIYAGPVTIL